MSTSVDFESMYQGDLPQQGVAGPGGTIPWDIGEPQPVLVELAESGRLTSEVLDAGCGLGDNSAFLARGGYHERLHSGDPATARPGGPRRHRPRREHRRRVGRRPRSRPAAGVAPACHPPLIAQHQW